MSFARTVSLLLSLVAGVSGHPALAQDVVRYTVARPVYSTQPTYAQPVYAQPVYAQPAYAQPAYVQPAYSQPYYVQQAYAQPAYAQPAYAQPAYAQPAYAQPAYAQPNYSQPTYSQSGDPYGFTAWLNGVRAQYGLGQVSHDPNLSGWASANNGQQQARGMGHHVMGGARRQNSGMGAGSTVWQMWMASPAHQAALLDPSITTIGIAASGSFWTFNAN